MITLATFTNRALLEGWTPVDRKHYGQGVVSATFTQDGISLSGTFYPASDWEPEGGFAVTLSDSDSGNFVCMAVYEDHTETTFSMAWALLELFPSRYQGRLDDTHGDPYEFCGCELCFPENYIDYDEEDQYTPLHPYEDYDPELAR